MSWISSNYEKVAIAGAVAVGLGCGYLGYKSYSAVAADFSHSLSGPRNNNDPSVAGAEDVPGALNSRSAAHVWEPQLYKGRSVNLFTGVALFVRRGSPEPVDLLASPQPVHPPITNDWWLTHDLDPSFEDSPARDADGDGFSALEEFLASTDPNDSRTHPPLITKLSYVGDETRTWLLEFSSDIGDNQYQFKYNHRDLAGRVANRTEFIAPGTKFFVEGAAANRFELVEVKDVEKKNPSNNMVETVKTASIRDLKPNKNNETFEVPRQMRNNRAAFERFDRSAVLVLKAIKEGANPFKIEENTSFSLPAGQAEKPFKLLKVTPESIEVEYPGADGSRATVVIPKGGVAPPAP